MSYDLLVCIRCHKHLDFVIDTMNSVEKNTDPNTCHVVFAVDAGNAAFASNLKRIVGGDRVYVSTEVCGWGAGLYSLLVCSILHFRHRLQFQHFQTIDYDTLYIGPGADQLLLERIDSQSIGLLGSYRTDAVGHWCKVFTSRRQLFEKLYGKLPASYKLGENVSGSYMTLTAELLHRMEARGMFSPPFSCIKQYMPLADDHFLPILVRMCELDIVNVSEFAKCSWRAEREPMGLEREGIRVFHPTKLIPRSLGREADVRVRNYYRKLRKEEALI
jgi:hypothetical protein